MKGRIIALMRRGQLYAFGVVSTILSLTLLSFTRNGETGHFDEIVKISLRDVGNKLLLLNGDSTSLIHPIRKLDANSFELSFQNKLSILPDSLVSVVSHSFEMAQLPQDYIVEVISRGNNEVAYSYQIKENVENNIIPCVGRNLPLDAYRIKILFAAHEPFLMSQKGVSIVSLVLIGCIGLALLLKPKAGNKNGIDTNSGYVEIGGYKFYQNQNKLVKGDLTVKLTAKECELIRLFGEHPNQILKRDFLEKEVWEDNGVVVGRSLDTFISRIRKKFRHDDSVNLVNVHGVGYRLEIS